MSKYQPIQQLEQTDDEESTLGRAYYPILTPTSDEKDKTLDISKNEGQNFSSITNEMDKRQNYSVLIIFSSFF